MATEMIYFNQKSNVMKLLIGKDSDAGRDWGQEEKGDDRG